MARTLVLLIPSTWESHPTDLAILKRHVRYVYGATLTVMPHLELTVTLQYRAWTGERPGAEPLPRIEQAFHRTP